MARSAEAHFRQTDMKSEADTIIYGHNKLRRPKAGQPLAVCTIIHLSCDNFIGHFARQ